MAGVENNHWISITLTLKHKSTLATKDIVLTNRAEIESYDPDNDHWPLIDSISRIGLASDRQSVLPDAGSFRIYNALGSFGVERKFTDLLERWSIQDQPLVIKYAQTEPGDYAPGSYSTYFTGKALDWRAVPNDDTPLLDISFDCRPFKKAFVCKKVYSDDFPDAPTKSYGKTLPVVFNNSDAPVEVKPVLISYTIAETIHYTTAIHAYATTLGTTFVNGGIQDFYVKDYDGIYREVRSSSTVGTAVWTNSDAYSAGVPVSLYEIATWTEHAPATNNYVMTHIEIEFTGGTPATYDGALEVGIYEGFADSSLGPAKKLASGRRPITAGIDGAFDSTASFYLRFALDKPLVMASSNGYWISVRHTPDVGAASIPARCSSDSTMAWYNDGSGWRAGSTGYRYRFQFYAMKYADTPTPSGSEVNSKGLGHSYFTLTETVTDTNWEEPDLSNLDIVVAINGLRDSSGGAVTGSANAQIEYVHHALELLQYEYNGSSWADSTKWDFTTYINTHTAASTGVYERTIRGTTTSDITYEALIRDLCRSAAAKIVMLKSGKLAIWQWGAALTPIIEFTQENAKVLTYAQLDTSYVVNRARVVGYPSFVNAGTVDLLSEGVPAQYQLFADISAATHTVAAEIVKNSHLLYGERINAETIFDWVGDDASATVLQKNLLVNYSEPPVYVTIETELENITDIEPMSKVTLKFPSLPAYFGTSPNAKLPEVDGEELELAYNLTRAQRVSALVEGMYIDFQQDESPRLILTTRLILNTSDPT